MIEDRTDNPTRLVFERDDADQLHDAERDRREERYALLNPSIVPRAGGPLARAMKRHAERQAQVVSDAAVADADSLWQVMA